MTPYCSKHSNTKKLENNYEEMGNKAELFRLVTEFMKALIPMKGKQATCTLDNNIVACHSTVQANEVPCSHEKLNICIMVYGKDATMQDLSSILLKATDMDIVAICISLFTDIGPKNIQVE